MSRARAALAAVGALAPRAAAEDPAPTRPDDRLALDGLHAPGVATGLVATIEERT